MANCKTANLSVTTSLALGCSSLSNRGSRGVTKTCYRLDIEEGEDEITVPWPPHARLWLSTKTR
ncbi:hypothetical protein L207DRAFT_116850 [Hyaloscypha variabilis F]|uniref:Uncharacterized protein n=1 Tax=Hyaloscypha variabilis (strain UAMH 11265 / GT02V1 / F) TaxID=1149755 RepID=A0A2J6RAG8_HYAVF|nr:hypothetical protein L207DRAFT_116850 [Hyaloscypha variabilis F]